MSANIQLFVIATRRSNLLFTMYIAISQNYDSSCVHNVSFNQRLRLRSVLEDLVGYGSGFRKGQNWISKNRPNIARLIESTKKKSHDFASYLGFNIEKTFQHQAPF